MPVDGDIILKAGLDTSGVTKRIDGLQKSISKGLKNVIRAGFGVRSVFALIRKLRSALFAGFGELAQVHEPFNQAMSSIMTSLNLLRNTFASAFAPIIETVAPIIVTFINLMANAVSAVGQFIAALTGKQYVAAGAVWKDYASSVDKSSKSTENATSATKKRTKAQKELNREITHFDDLVILHDKDDDDTDTTPAVSPDVGFAPAGIGDAVSQFAKDFKAALADWDFKDIGRTISEKLRKALEKIPWETEIYPAANNFGTGLATFLNGLITPELFGEIGDTVADVLNTALHFLDSFGTRFDWTNFGTSLANGLKKFFKKWDADLTADVFSKFVNGIQKAMKAALANFPAYAVGSKISSAVKKALRQIRWEDVFTVMSLFGTKLASFLNGLIRPETFAVIGTTLGSVLTGAVHFLDNFGTTFNWTNFGNSIATGINNLFNNFKFAQLALALFNFATGILTTATAAMSGIDWTALGRNIRDALEGIDWTTLLTKVGELIVTAINSALDIAKGLFDGTPISEQIESLKSTINQAVEAIDFPTLVNGFTNLVEAIKPAAEGFGAGLIAVMQIFIKVGADLLNAIGPALQAVADALNSMDPDVLEAIGAGLSTIVTALLIVNGLTAVAGVIKGVATALIGIKVGATTALGSYALSGGGLLGVLYAFGNMIPLITAATIAITLFTEKIASTEEELKPLNDAHETTLNVLTALADQYGLTSDEIAELAWEMEGATSVNSDAAGTYELIDTKLSNAGISVDEFKGKLQDMANKAQAAGQDTSTLQAYIDNIGTSSSKSKGSVAEIDNAIKELGDTSSTTNTNTSDVGEAVSKFNGLSITAPIKVGLIAAAIKTLGERGTLTKEESTKLFQALDDYKADPTEENMGKVGTAFENAGVAATDFYTALATALASSDKDTQQKVRTILTNIGAFSSSGKTKGKNVGSSIGTGIKEGVTSKSKEINTASANTITTDVIGAMNTAGDIHSPSGKTKEIGGYLIDGLIEGLGSRDETLKTTVDGIVEGIQTEIETYSLDSQGSALMDTLSDGISSKSETLLTTIDTLMLSIHTKAGERGFYDIGSNIGYGIYNGLFEQSETLQILAWNTAVDMYNSACEALGIASPSKKFAWVGEMITAGLGDGVKDNEDYAIDATEGLVNSIYGVAEDANPAVAIDMSVGGWIDTLDNVLTSFSDAVTTKFDTLINYLSNLNVTSITLPPVAQGKVIPSSMRASNDTDSIAGLISALQNIAYDRLTTDDLRTLLVEMFTQYMNFGFYLGDEQIARHANSGNAKLSRKYNTI